MHCYSVSNVCLVPHVIEVLIISANMSQGLFDLIHDRHQRKPVGFYSTDFTKFSLEFGDGSTRIIPEWTDVLMVYVVAASR